MAEGPKPPGISSSAATASANTGNGRSGSAGSNIANMIVAGNPGNREQALAVRPANVHAAAATDVLETTGLHENHRERGHPDIAHAIAIHSH
jgi:hypothetical protein